MFEKIIIASELNQNTKKVIAPLASLKKFGANECLILQCIKPEELVTEYREMILNWYQTNMDEEKAILKKMGYSVEERITEGQLKNEIGKIAESEDYSLVVVGAEITSKAGEIFWGGAAHEVVHHPVKPILQVRVQSEESERLDIDPLALSDHILFPTDFSDNAEKAFQVLLSLADYGLNKVTLVNICPFEEEVPLAEELILPLKERLAEKNINEIDTKVLFGNPTKELLKVIKADEVSLVLMGTQGRGIIEDIFLGSVSHNIARHSEASVLLIPAE